MEREARERAEEVFRKLTKNLKKQQLLIHSMSDTTSIDETVRLASEVPFDGMVSLLPDIEPSKVLESWALVSDVLAPAEDGKEIEAYHPPLHSIAIAAAHGSGRIILYEAPMKEESQILGMRARRPDFSVTDKSAERNPDAVGGRIPFEAKSKRRDGKVVEIKEGIAQTLQYLTIVAHSVETHVERRWRELEHRCAPPPPVHVVLWGATSNFAEAVFVALAVMIKPEQRVGAGRIFFGTYTPVFELFYSSRVPLMPDDRASPSLGFDALCRMMRVQRATLGDFDAIIPRDTVICVDALYAKARDDSSRGPAEVARKRICVRTVSLLGRGAFSMAYSVITSVGGTACLKLHRFGDRHGVSQSQSFEEECRRLAKLAGTQAAAHFPRLVEVERLAQVEGESVGDGVLVATVGTPLCEHIRNVTADGVKSFAHVLMRALLRALDAAHRAKVYHGDIRVSNIVMDGITPVLIDWGMTVNGVRTTTSEYRAMNDRDEVTTLAKQASDLRQALLVFLTVHEARGGILESPWIKEMLSAPNRRAAIAARDSWVAAFVAEDPESAAFTFLRHLNAIDYRPCYTAFNETA